MVYGKLEASHTEIRTAVTEGRAMDDIYEFRVEGHLYDRWSDWLGGLAIRQQEDGTTLLVGPVVDQAALHGVIVRIRDLGVPLLSVRRALEPRGRTKQESSIGNGLRAQGDNYGASNSRESRQHRRQSRDRI